MKQIENYLKNSNTKEKIMLYASFPILIFIFYYNFIHEPFVEKESKLNKTKKDLIAKISKIKSNKIKYEGLKKEFYKLETNIENLTRDYRYARISFNSLELIKLDESKFLNIIEYLLYKAKKRELDVSLYIDKSVKVDEHFNQNIEIKIKGIGYYSNFVNYINDIEGLDSVYIFKDILMYEVSDNVNSANKVLDSLKVPFGFFLNFSNHDPLDLNKRIIDSAENMKIELTTNLKNNNLLVVSGKGYYDDVRMFLKSTQRLKDVSITKLSINLNNVNKNRKENIDKINKKSFEIKFDLVGLK
jgi:Tfp pilus assembly protein PilO